MVIVKESKIHGKGAFAETDIKRGTILTCDVLEIEKSEKIKKYIFSFIGNRVCIHIGFASFLNSSKNPNLKHLKIDIATKISYFKTIKELKKGEELTLKY